MLESERLILRNPTVDDADEILEIHNSYFVRKYNMMPIFDKEMMIQEIMSDFKNTYYIFLKESNVLIGAIFISEDMLRYRVSSVNISYYLAQQYQRNGYMYEALQLVIDCLFKNGKAMISARVFKDNIASKCLLEKLGFELEGCLKNAVRDYFDVVHDDLLYVLSR